MAAYLWTDAPPPLDYIEMALCRTYHCLPSQLADEDWVTLRKHLAMMATESEIAKAKREK